MSRLSKKRGTAERLSESSVPKEFKLKRKSSERRCRTCGKSAYPNYFFCPACHHKLSEVSCHDDPEEYIASNDYHM